MTTELDNLINAIDIINDVLRLHDTQSLNNPAWNVRGWLTDLYIKERAKRWAFPSADREIGT